jgi:DNA adenine methylase
LNAPLTILWREILNNPAGLADTYEALWQDQHPDKKDFFLKIRQKFNKTHQPELLLYLLARIVKGAVRYSSDGAFNQSADNRRAGMRPGTMRQQLLGVSRLLSKKTTVSSSDFRKVLDTCVEQDLVYMDPPYQGTSFTRDHRYCGGLLLEDFVSSLERLNENNISYIISYDGYTGNKAHGKALPQHLMLKHLLIDAGRSSQSTLLGGSEKTVESLYLSPALVTRLEKNNPRSRATVYSEPQLALI